MNWQEAKNKSMNSYQPATRNQMNTAITNQNGTMTKHGLLAARIRRPQVRNAVKTFLTGFTLVFTLLFILGGLANAATVTLLPDNIVSATGWSAATVGNLSDAADGTAASTGTDASVIRVDFENSAAYSGATINSVTIYVRAQSSGSGGKETIELSKTGGVSSGTNNLVRGVYDPTVSYLTPESYADDAAVDALQVDVTASMGGGENVSVADIWVIVDYSGACVDPDAPTLTIFSPTESSTISDTTRINLQITGEGNPENFTNVTFTINGGAPVFADGWDGSYWYLDLDTTAEPDGATTIDTQGDDPDCGDTVAAVTRNVTINNAGLPNALQNCSSCHKYPPEDSATRNSPIGSTVGSHAAHIAVTGVTCATCHAIPPTETSADFDHRDENIDMKVAIESGTYSKGASFVQSDTPTMGNCSNVNCHGGAASSTPDWGDAAGLDCNGCHQSPPGTDAHLVHYQAKGWGTNPGDDPTGINCTFCHPDNTSGHSDVTDGVKIVNGSLTPSGSAPTISCGSAPALGCHNGQATPNWDTGAAITCTDCHTPGGSNVGQANPVSGLHNMSAAGVQKHDASIAGGCEACHTKASIGGHWDGSNGGDPPNYTDVQVGVSPGVTGGSYTDASGTGAVRGTCATTCHSDNAGWSRQWSTAADSVSTTAGNARCDVCHGQFQAIGGGWRTGTSHEGTFGGSASTRGSGHNGLGSAANACEDCHAYPSLGNHENGSITVNQDGGWTVTESGAPNFRAWCQGCHSDDGVPSSSGTHTFVQSDTGDGVFPLETVAGANDPSGSCFGCHGGGTAGVSQSNYWPDDSNANAMNTAGTHVTHLARIASRLYGETITGAADDDVLMDNTSKNPGVDSDTKQKNICEYCHAATANDSDHGVEGNLPAEVFVDADTVRHAKTLWGANDPNATRNYGPDTCSTHACHNDQTTLDGTYGWYDLDPSDCVMCHTLGGTTNIGSGIIHPNSGLHNITPTISGQTHDDTLDAAGCKKCHALPIIDETGASTHVNGTAVADGSGNNDRGLFADYSDAATGTCSGGTVGAAGCHDGAGEAGSWARRWSLTADDGGDAVCANCHGGLGANDWTFGGDNLPGDGDVSHGRNWDEAYSSDGTAEVIGNHSGNTNSSDKCNVCHVNPDAPYDSTWVTGNHGDNQIDMNSTFGYTQASWNCSSACHTGAANTDHTLEDSGWTVNTLAGPGLNCTSCHTTKAAGAAGVGTDSPHVKTTRAGSFNACEDCHPGNTKGAQHSKNGDNNVVVIPNNASVGISYSHTVDGATQGFVLGGDATVGTTQAEICWNCHDDEATDISEWDTNTGGTYDYGSVDNNNLNWTTTNWQSANFAYKNGALGTRPTDGDDSEPAGPGAGTGGDSASIHANGGTWPGSSNTLSEVACAYCHDVHDTGGGVNGQPFLRGSWTPSDYLEDGAPQTGTTYSTHGNYAVTTNGPPRTNAGENALGGYQIDQNNGTNHASYVYANDDGLCANCHDQATLQTQAPLHKNSVQGFSNDTATARNIFNNADRSTAVVRQDPGMAYQGVTDYADSKGWMGGFRNILEPGGAATGIYPTVDNQSYGYEAASYEWGVNVTNTTTVQTDFHSFTCSKCHNPHASRLPRLMITNCLDVQRNSWDDDYIEDDTTPGENLSTEWNAWGNLTPSSGNEGHQELAYANTSQNCHRYFAPSAGSGSGIYEGKGWNKVTPW